MKGFGRIAYEAYAVSTGGKTWDGRDMPTWENLTEKIRHAWLCAALAVRTEAAAEPRV